MKTIIYVVDGTPEDLANIKALCDAERFVVKESKGFGRPRLAIGVQKVMNASQDRDKGLHWRDIGEKQGCSAGTIFRRCRDLDEDKENGAD